MLDRGSRVLRSYQSPAELFAEHSAIAQGHERFVG